MLAARSPKYPALYDVESGVRFRRGRAEVTAEQALALAKRRFVDGILVEGIPAKKWAQQQESAPPLPAAEPAAESTDTAPDNGGARKTRKAT